MWQAGATLHRGARASHHHGLSYCGAQAPDAQAQQLWLTGLVAPWHVGSSQTRARTRVPCIGRQILNHCATREAHPSYYFGRVCVHLKDSMIMYKILGSASLPIQPINWFFHSPTRLRICWDHPDCKHSVPSSNLCQITSSLFVVNIWSPSLQA